MIWLLLEKSLIGHIRLGPLALV